MAVFETNHILNITSVSEPFPHGQRISYAVVEYDRDIRNSALLPEQFQVENRTLTRIYANSEGKKDAIGRDGKYVIIELSLYDQDAPLFITLSETGRGITSGQDTKPWIGKKNFGAHKGGPPRMAKVVVAENRLAVTQCGDVTAADGTVIAAVNDKLASRNGVNMVIDDFTQFYDAQMPYNLYIPKDYDPNKKYPMVVFVADASVRGKDILLPLVQGNGAVSFATPEAQAKHPCFVLTPLVPTGTTVTSDSGTGGAGDLPEKLMDVIKMVMKKYAIDDEHIYTTGQSLGCINAYACAVRYPHFFAAYLCVGGQWSDTVSLRHMKDDNMWMLNSDGDARAYPGMNEIYNELIDAGASITRSILDAKLPKKQIEAEALKTAESGNHILYTTFCNESVVPDGVSKSPVSNHMNTWPVAYSIGAVHDWLFQQKRRLN